MAVSDWNRQGDTLIGAQYLSSNSAITLPGADDQAIGVEQMVGVELLHDLPEERYHLLCPLPLTVYRTPDYYWVAPDQLALHGIGNTRQEAVEDYAHALLDYYEDLCDNRELLAPHLVAQLEYLETIIVED